MAAHEIGDRIRADGVKRKFWTVLSEFARKLWRSAGTIDMNEAEWEKCALRSEMNGREYARRDGPFFVLSPVAMARREDPYSRRLPGKEALRAQLWKVWQAYKRSPEFDRNVWAMECGFPNWSRMRRGCLLAFGM